MTAHKLVTKNIRLCVGELLCLSLKKLQKFSQKSFVHDAEMFTFKKSKDYGSGKLIWKIAMN